MNKVWCGNTIVAFFLNADDALIPRTCPGTYQRNVFIERPRSYRWPTANPGSFLRRRGGVSFFCLEKIFTKTSKKRSLPSHIRAWHLCAKEIICIWRFDLQYKTPIILQSVSVFSIKVHPLFLTGSLPGLASAEKVLHTEQRKNPYYPEAYGLIPLYYLYIPKKIWSSIHKRILIFSSSWHLWEKSEGLEKVLQGD